MARTGQEPDIPGGGDPTRPGPASPVIVAIDDDALTRKMLHSTLASSGFVCHTASGGKEGLALIAKEGPDLVLLDLILAGEDGFQICEELRRTWGPQELPVVVVTGLEDFGSIERAYLAGANDFLTKPLHWMHLPFHLRHLLRANQAFKDLHRSTRTLRSVFAAHPDPIFFVDWGGHVTLVHRGGKAGPDEPERSLGHLRDLLPEGLAAKVGERCRAALTNPRRTATLEAPFLWEGELRHWEGRFVACGEDLVLVMVRDMTERRDFERRIQHMAYHDSLTGLWNRHALTSALERHLRNLERAAGTPFARRSALLYLDLDHFKRINDTLGHALGDDLLKVVASRIEEVLRPTDMLARPESREEESLARVGGDEFCVLLTQLADPTDAAKVAARIVEAVRAPIELEGHELVVTPSIGIALMPEDGADPDTLLKHADRAMYVAKEGGRNRIEYFDPSMDSHLLERFALEAGIRRALAQGAFHVHFQPKVDSRSGALLGMEALARWEDPEMGKVSPAKFIPVAEETGLIVELGEVILRDAMNFNRSLQNEGLPPLRVAVNLSSAQMQDPRLLERLERCLSESGLDPRYLEVEVTESLLLEGTEGALAILNRMKALGIALALDDFGTGYSSLSYLHRYPFDILKIDQSFVRSMMEDPQSQTLATAIISMGQSLGLELVAEGVEYAAQAEFLLAEGCHIIQGYLFGKPMDLEAFRAFYRERVAGAPLIPPPA